MSRLRKHSACMQINCISDHCSVSLFLLSLRRPRWYSGYRVGVGSNVHRFKSSRGRWLSRAMQSVARLRS
jgi:hypothetical protein